MPATGFRDNVAASAVFTLPFWLIQSGRPLSSCVAGALSSAAIWIRTGFSLQVILAGLAMCAVTMYGFVINDLLDLPKDAAAGVDRPIARGLLSWRSALPFAVALLAAAWALSRLIGPGQAVLMLTGAAVTLYTPAARAAPALKGMLVAVLCLTPLFYSARISKAHAAGLAYAIIAVFVFGRETLMDAHELNADRQAGLRTIAVVLGATSARHLGSIAMVLALLALAFVARGHIGKTAALTSLTSLIAVFLWPHLAEGRRIALSRFPMLAAAIALATAWA